MEYRTSKVEYSRVNRSRSLTIDKAFHTIQLQLNKVEYTSFVIFDDSNDARLEIFAKVLTSEQHAIRRGSRFVNNLKLCHGN